MNIAGILALGNPGAKYEATRHNVGIWLIERWAERTGETLQAGKKLPGRSAQWFPGAAGGGSVRVLASGTYMNASGGAAAALVQYYDIDPGQLLVIHDEMDLPAGRARFKRGGGPGGHNGLTDIIKALGTPDFWRLRIGIDRPQQRGYTDYVLGHPGGAARQAILECIERTLDVFDEFCCGDPQRAIQRLHSEPAA
ncbi:MAG: aminoacyl-tRNA hydrolase [Gammaproteobacteria bacterium AqS3]|nr:aminoacyl-tRNA hydrolase [Gammaproteobacteria bacterium AqS3]